MDKRKIEGLWVHLYWLSVLSEQGSFTAAAAHLGVSKASMSQHISELESTAGISLVQRSTRSVRLTEAGQRLVENIREHYALIGQSFSSVRDAVGEPRGTIRVTAPVAFARQQLVPVLPAFLAMHPEIQIELELSDRLSSLATEGFDLAIRHNADVPDTHVAANLCATHSVLVATQVYLKRRGTPTAPADLTQHACLYYPRTRDQPAWTFEPMQEALAAGATRTTIPIGGPFSANNSEALREAALGHLGIALLPDFSAEAALRSGALVKVLPGWRPSGAFASQLFVVRPYAAYVPRGVSVFTTYLRETFSGGFEV